MDELIAAYRRAFKAYRALKKADTPENKEAYGTAGAAIDKIIEKIKVATEPYRNSTGDGKNTDTSKVGVPAATPEEKVKSSKLGFIKTIAGFVQTILSKITSFVFAIKAAISNALKKKPDAEPANA